MKELFYLNKYLIKYKGYLLAGLAFIIISNMFHILPAPLVRLGIDLVLDNLQLYKVFNGSAMQPSFQQVLAGGVLLCALLILAAAVLRGLFLYLVRQTVIVMSRHVEYDLKNEIFRHYQSLPLSFYRKHNTGDLMNRISEDVSRVRMYLGPTIMYGLQLVTLFLILIPYMFSISTRLTMVALLPLPILSISIFFVNNVIVKRSEQIQQSQSRLSTIVQESFSGIRVIKSFIREADVANRFVKESNEYKQQSLLLTRVEAMFFPLIMGLIGLSVILTVYAGSVEVINGRLSFGNIAEFIMYVSMLTWPVASLGWTISQLKRAEASQKRINEFLKQQSPILSGEKKGSLEGKLIFDRVSFTYPDSGIQALDEVSFELTSGDSLAIIGATGSGKSTVTNLVSRLYDVTKGSILIDDVPITQYELSTLRSQIGVVPQDVFLFSDTIHNNIAFGVSDPSQEQVHQAAKDADVYNNIMEFPMGFETRVGERGITLSGGQKQRVSIARALIKAPAILLLDDSLSAVDTKTEHRVLNSLKTIMQNRTSIIVSHRVSSAKLANKIIVLEDGRIVEKGTHATLLKKKGVYQKLYKKQLQEAQEEDLA